MKTINISSRLMALLLVLLFHSASALPPNSNTSTNGGLFPVHYIFVNSYTSAQNPPDGKSWSTAYGDLQQALDVAQAGDTILVASGIYYPSKDNTGNSTPTDSRMKTFNIPNGVKLFGGFNAYASVSDIASLWNSRDIENNQSRLSGAINTSSNTDNCYNIVQMGDSTEINGFYISEGYADGTVVSNITNSGGGINIYQKNMVKVVFCFFENNVGYNAGALAVYSTQNNNIKIKRCVFVSNTCTNGGGAIGLWDANVRITNCGFFENSAANFASAIYCWGAYSTAQIVNCTFYGNVANGNTDNGAIHSRAPMSDVRNCIFWANTGNDIDGSNGGGSNVSYSDIQQSGYSGSNGNISADPKFKDPVNNDFHLQLSSPCIDAGTSVLAPDFDYQHRPYVDIPSVSNTGAGTPNYIDMGMVEYSQDVGVVQWAGDTDLCSLSSAMQVKVLVENYSADTLNNIPISYIYDNASPVNATIAQINPGQSIIYTFAQTINASTNGHHSLNIYIAYSGDNNADNDSLTVGWRNVLPISSFPYTENFEDGVFDHFTYNENVNKGLFVGIVDGIGKGDTKGLEIHGSETYNSSWNYPSDVTTAFQNDGYRTQIFNCQVNAASLSNLALSFDLKQHKSWNNMNSVFRVMINDTIYAKTFDGDSVFYVRGSDNEYAYTNLIFDLSAFVNTSFKLTFDAITYVYQPGFDEDFIRIDNIYLWERQAYDIGLVDLGTNANSNCGSVNDSLFVLMYNYGTNTASNIPVSGSVSMPDGSTINYNQTLSASLPPLQDTILYMGLLNTTEFGDYVLNFVSALSGDAIQINDSLHLVATNKHWPVPYFENFDAENDEWYSNGFYRDYNSTNNSFAYAVDANGGQGNTSHMLAIEDRIGPLTDKSYLKFDYSLDYPISYDTLFVEISGDCKSNWTSYSYTNLSSGYFQETIPLSAFSGAYVFVRFRVNTHGLDYYKLYIDNVALLNSIMFNLGNDTTLCGGDSLVLSPGYGSSGYNTEWYKVGASGILSTDSVYTVSESGTYISKVNDNYGNYYSDTINVTILPKPQATFISSGVAVCSGDSVNSGIVFTGQSPFIYTLMDAEGMHTDTSYSVYSPYKTFFAASGTAIITEMRTSYGCIYYEDMDSLFVTVNALPTVSLSNLNASYCNTEAPVGLVLSPAGGVLAGSGTNNGFFYPNLALTGTNILTYSYTDANGCSNVDTAVVLVNQAPAVSFTMNLNTSYCQDADTVSLSAQPTGGTFTGSGVSGNTFYPSQASAGTVQITYNVTDVNGCSAADSLSTTVYALPTVSWAALAPVCANGNPVNLSGASPAGGTYSGPGVVQGVFYPALAPVGSDTLTYAYVDNHGCYNEVKEAVNVKAVPMAGFTLPATLCKDDTAQIAYTGSGGASTYWDFDGAQILSGTGNGPYEVRWLNAGVKGVKLLASQNGCFSDTLVKLTNVLSSFAQITAVGNTTVCYGDSVTLFANVGPGYSYQWFDTSGTFTGDTLSYYVAGQSGAYFCQVTPPNGCSALSNTINVSIRNQVTADFALPSTACQGDLVPITYNGTSGASAQYNWNFDGALVASGTGLGPYSVIWNSDSVKTVSLTVTDNGCSSLPMDKQILIHSVKAQITALGSTGFCDGDSVTLYATAGPYDYSWKHDGVAVNVHNPSYSAKQAGQYSVVLTDTILGCMGESDSLLVTVNTTDFSLAFTANPTSFNIPPFNTQITNQTPNSSDYYWQWDLGDGNTSNLVSPAHQYLYDGTYTVSLFAEDINTGCRDTLVKSNYITCTGGSPNPCNLVAAISPSGAATICPGDSLMLTAASNPPGTNYKWLKDGVLINGASDTVLYVKTPGMYQVMVSDATCSQYSQAFALSNYSVIVPTIQANGSIMPCTNDSMQLFVTTFFNSYQWNNGATTQSIYIKNSGSYEVTVSDANGCQTHSQPYVVNASLLQTPEICIVGVDSATNHNVVVWERQANPLIDSFRVYRESVVAGIYDPIGTLPFSTSGAFIDTASNPLQRAYRYKITAIDTCGQETPPSAYHQTIHLNINAGINNTWNLIWEGYHGFNFGSYRIYRGSDSTQMQLLTQIQSTLNSFTDLNPPAGKVYYQIEVESPHPCYPDSIYSKAKTNYNTSRSNRVNTTMAPNTGMGYVMQNQLAVSIYPNPNKGMFTLLVQHPGKVKSQITILNGIGELVYSEDLTFAGRNEHRLDLRQLPKGVYFVRVKTEQEILTAKMIID